MLSRLLPKPSHFRYLTVLSSSSRQYHRSENHSSHFIPRFFSTGNNNRNNGSKDSSTTDVWKLSRDSDRSFDHLFNEEAENVNDNTDKKPPAGKDDSWLRTKGSDAGSERDIFDGLEEEKVGGKSGGDGGDEWATAQGYKPWSLVEEEKDVFDIDEGIGGVSETRFESRDVERGSDENAKKLEEEQKLEREKQELSVILKGPNRAFGDLVAISGITDEMLDSLIALKDLEGVEGLPPLSEIEDMRYEKNTRKSSRAEIERLKQEEASKARVRQVDDKGRAYGTGRRKCSIARVWIQPGDGKFIVNDKEFDVYFPMLDSRAALLRPFTETKTLGLWDVNCTVKGGGVTGQVGAVQLGISRALQNWEPDLRPPLKAVGFLTRDPRAVERKKPGKAKARKSFQWVKR